MLSKLPKVTELVSGETEIQTQVGALCPYFAPSCYPAAFHEFNIEVRMDLSLGLDQFSITTAKGNLLEC